MKNVSLTPTQLFIYIVIVIGAIGFVCAVMGMASSTISLLKNEFFVGVLCVILDLSLIVFCIWAIIEGIIKPLKEIEHNEKHN